MIKIFLGIIRNKFSFGIALISTIMIMNGCAAFSSIKPEESPKIYKISVDGYKKREGLNVTKDAKIYVYKNNQASNILLEKEVILMISKRSAIVPLSFHTAQLIPFLLKSSWKTKP